VRFQTKINIIRLQALDFLPTSQLNKMVIKVHNYYDLTEAEMIYSDNHDENENR
jgi:hypothetical protein